MERVDVRAECPGEPDVGDGGVAGVFEQQVDTGAQRRLGELHGPDVVLGDRQLGPGVAVEDVSVRPAVGHDPIGPGRVLAEDRPVGVDDPGEEHLGEQVDDSRPTQPGDSGRGDRHVESGLVAPRIDADHLHPSVQRLGVDANALDGAGRRSLSAADLRALERRAGGAGRGELAVPVAEHDLGVGADVDDESHVVAAVGTLGEDHRRGVGADMTGDARAGVERGERQVELEVIGRSADRCARRQRERGASQRGRVDAEHAEANIRGMKD